jgi:hypothetical protein
MTGNSILIFAISIIILWYNNEEPRGKPQGIFVGEEIYYTGGAIPQLQFFNLLVKYDYLNRYK